ncbi:T9SS type A sorting domain-containing protein [Pontibacter qinzhouensis]|uniref:T9SS type A sorting domain-containing protein n=1 Tax=Pontibacter qinzhouensis TaxID=2603253 RepID=UPI0016509414|nr:T9SS type A sorting domain-containing protein [Pontibacter qinzhouensis]
MHNQTAAQTGKYISFSDVIISGTTMPAEDEDPGDEEPAGIKKVLYVTEIKVMHETATTVESDPIIRMLRADENIELTVKALTQAEANAADTEVDMAGFDAIVVQESMGGNRAILTPAGTLGLAKFTAPTLYNKTYALNGGRAFTTNTAGGGAEAAVEGTPVLAITVPAANQTNALFNGLTFTETGTAPMFKTGSLDNGGPAETGLKALNYSNATVLSATNTLLASVAGLAEEGTPVFLNDLPSGTMIGSEAIQTRMIMMGMNFGAISKDNGTNMTAENLTLWRNAVYSLAGLPVPTTAVDPAVVTSVRNNLATASFNLGQNYPNPFNGSTTIAYELKKSGFVALEVYDALGRKVATLANGNQAAGTYEVKLNKNLSNGMYFYKLSTDGSSLTRRMLVTQ